MNFVLALLIILLVFVIVYFGKNISDLQVQLEKTQAHILAQEEDVVRLRTAAHNIDVKVDLLTDQLKGLIGNGFRVEIQDNHLIVVYDVDGYMICKGVVTETQEKAKDQPVTLPKKSKKKKKPSAEITPVEPIKEDK